MEDIRVLPQDERYGVTVDGKVWSRACGRPWKPLVHTYTKRGYAKVKLGQFYTVLVHSLVAQMFVGDRPDGMTINHKDGDKANASATNLEYVTQRDNNLHAWQAGLQRSGWDKRRERAGERGFGGDGCYA